MSDREKITFILGAGASKEYDIYTQKELTEKIKNHFATETNNFTKTIMHFGVDFSFIEDLRNALIGFTGSIDEWLKDNPRFREVGKKIISLLLLNCENDMDVLERQGWCYYLYENHLKPVGDETLEDFSSINDNFSFITFNYDRTFEHFIHKYLNNHYWGRDTEVEEQLKGLNILHVYGCFGNLKWQDPINNIPFGTFSRTLNHLGADDYIPSDHEIPRRVGIASENISLMYGRELTDEFKQAHIILENSDKIYFFGFGYHEDNLAKLGFNISGNYLNKHIKGTSKKSPTYHEKISRFTNGLISDKNLAPSDCTDFIQVIEPEILGFK